MGKVTINDYIIKNKEDFIGLCEFDEDLNGGNGAEFTMPEALANGFSTSGQYIADKALRNNETFEEAIHEAMEFIIDTDESYLGYKVKDLGNEGYQVMVAMEDF